jgi:hypothetical protein
MADPTASIGGLRTVGTAAITTSEAALAKALPDIGDGDKVTSMQLFAFQMDTISNSLTVTTVSTAGKERGDTFKGVVRNFS